MHEPDGATTEKTFPTPRRCGEWRNGSRATGRGMHFRPTAKPAKAPLYVAVHTHFRADIIGCDSAAHEAASPRRAAPTPPRSA